MIIRSKRSVKAVVNGQNTKLAGATKDGESPLVFWYFIQFPCGGWRDFDIRAITNVQDDFYWKKEAERLQLVAELIADIDVFSMIRQGDAVAA